MQDHSLNKGGYEGITQDRTYYCDYFCFNCCSHLLWLQCSD
jgi:hypothetical protein